MLRGRNYLKTVVGSAFNGLSDEGWTLLTRRWALFFLLLGLTNELLWRAFPTNIWLHFKIWGDSLLTFLFNSFAVALLSTALTLFVATLAGYALARLNLRPSAWLSYRKFDLTALRRYLTFLQCPEDLYKDHQSPHRVRDCIQRDINDYRRYRELLKGKW